MYSQHRFDNQEETGYPRAERALLGESRILEINPVTKQIVWEYTGRMIGQSEFSFFSPYISSVQRLPNGNTLIDESINSRFFQVTRGEKNYLGICVSLHGRRKKRYTPRADLPYPGSAFRLAAGFIRLLMDD